MITLLTTTSLLVPMTSGTRRRIASASRYLRPGVNRFASFLAVGSLSTLPSFCSTIGVMTMLLAPSSFISSRIACSAPLPMASIAITDATPNRMPSEVKPGAQLIVRERFGGGARAEAQLGNDRLQSRRRS